MSFCSKKSIEEIEREVFQTFLVSIIYKDFDWIKKKEFVDEILKEAQLLINSGNYFDVDCKHFNLVSDLFEASFIKDFDLDNLTDEDYQKVINYLKNYKYVDRPKETRLR